METLEATMETIILKSKNPVVIEITGGHEESNAVCVKCADGHSFTEGKINIDLRGDFNASTEYIDLKIADHSLGNLSSGVQDWKFHRVKTDEDITSLIKGAAEFVIEAIPSPAVHQLYSWPGAWGIVISLSYKTSDQKLQVSNWKLNERVFEPEDNATYTFDLENVSGYDLKNVIVHLVKDEGAWKNSNITVIDPINLNWTFPVLLSGEKKQLVLSLKSDNSPVGEYPLPQLEVELEYSIQVVDFYDTSFAVEVGED
jgi:hypothetical protein